MEQNREAVELKFANQVRKLEVELFPEFNKNKIYAPSNSQYFYFAPSWHVESGLFTHGDFVNIKKGGNFYRLGQVRHI